MNGICVALMLGLVASAAAYPYPSKQLRIRQVVVPPAGSGSEPEVVEPPSRFPPYDFGRKLEVPEVKKEEEKAEIVEVPDLDEHKPEEKIKSPFIIKPEANAEEEAVEVEGEEEEKKEEEEQKEEEKYEEEEKEKEEYKEKEEHKEEEEEKEEYVKAPEHKEEEQEAEAEEKEKEEEKDSSSSSSSSEEKSGEHEVKSDGEKDAEIDPLVQAAHYDEDHHEKAELVPKAAPKPEACAGNSELKKRVEAIIAELHEIKELCCKIEGVEPKEEEAY